MCCTNHYAAVQLHRTMALNGCTLLVKLHADLLSRHASPLEVYVLWRSTKEVKIRLYVRRDLSSMQRTTAKK